MLKNSYENIREKVWLSRLSFVNQNVILLRVKSLLC